MKLPKLIHLLVLLALVACVPTAGPSISTPTPTATSTNTANVFGQSTPTPTPTATTAPPPSSGPPSLTPSPADTATAAPSPTSSQPQFGHQTKTAGCQAQGPFPDLACTPGAIFNVTKDQICVSGYSASVRNVPTSEKDAVYAEYGITSHATGQYEVDHFVSLELGGSNDISNLWPEAASPTPGFHQKDQVENYLHDQVCKGAITLAEAQAEIATNWLAVYAAMGGNPPPAPTSTRAPAFTRTPAPVVVASDTPELVQATATEAVIAPTDTQPAPADTPTQSGGGGARVRVGALCNDGTSSTATGSGACSHHKGVQCWKYSDGTCTNP